MLYFNLKVKTVDHIILRPSSFHYDNVLASKNQTEFLSISTATVVSAIVLIRNLLR